MSLDHALAFYQALSANASLREAYQDVCSELPELPYLGNERDVLRQWHEEKILHFAANQGYCFGLGDLYRVWFGKEDYRCDRSESPGWRIRAIAALNRQMGEPIIPRNFEAGAA